MSPETKSKPTKICPTCGTRVSEDAPRCLVCGTDLSVSEKPARPAKAPVQGSRMPEITLTLPAVLGMLVLVMTVGAAVVYFAMNSRKTAVAEATLTPTVTTTATVTITPTPLTPTPTNTPLPTPTPLSYIVKLGDNCGKIAYSFNVSINSIVMSNNLPADCSALFEGQKLQIPQPTPTFTPLPSATLDPEHATLAACKTIDYTVQSNDTLSSIATNYAVSMDAIRQWNGKVNDLVRFGEKLKIPLCKQKTSNATATPTVPPPYPAANLLLPADGAAFMGASDTVTLQWAAVGTLREKESYAVTIEDVTSGQGRKYVEYVNDSKFVLPNNLRPDDNAPHIFRWWVLTVRQVGTDTDGNPVWDVAGAPSSARVFVWMGAGSAPAGATPTP